MPKLYANMAALDLHNLRSGKMDFATQEETEIVLKANSDYERDRLDYYGMFPTVKTEPVNYNPIKHVIADDQGYRYANCDGYDNIYAIYHRVMTIGGTIFKWTPEWFIWMATKDNRLMKKVVNCLDHFTEQTIVWKITTILERKYDADLAKIFLAVMYSGKEFYSIGRIDNGNEHFFNVRDLQCMVDHFDFKTKPTFGGVTFAIPTVEESVMFKLSYDLAPPLEIIEVEQLIRETSA